MSLIDKVLQNSRLKHTAIITDSKVFSSKDQISTSVPILNIALSGDIDGGFGRGSTTIAGQSRVWKSNLILLMASEYLKKYKDGVLLFYDTEFGASESYFKTFGIDTSRVVHSPVLNVEELKFDLMNQLNSIVRGDKVMIIIDSLGNIASKKEADDALEAKSKTDMTRAKAIKSLFRLATSHLNIKDIPMICINHVYKDMGLFPKDIMSGGSGVMLNSNTVFFISRRQEKEGTEVTGYHFTIKIEKSRTVREGSKFPISVNFDGGIQKYSGLIDIAMELGYIQKPKQGWYEAINPTTGEVLSTKLLRAKEINESEDFWENMFKNTDFKEAVVRRYKFEVHDSPEDLDEVVEVDSPED